MAFQKNFSKSEVNPGRKEAENTVLKFPSGPSLSPSPGVDTHLPRPLVPRHQEHCVYFLSGSLALHLISCLSFGQVVTKDLVFLYHKSSSVILSPKQDILTEETFCVDHYVPCQSAYIDIIYIYIYLMTRWYEFWTSSSLSVPVFPLLLNCAPFSSLTSSELYPRTLPCGQLSIPVKLPRSVRRGSRSHAVTLPFPEDVHRAGNKVSLTEWRRKFHILLG